MLRLTRRHFLIASSALVAPEAWAQSQSKNPDVVIIGAGAAGMAAARDLISAGHQVVVLEASDRIGGRIHTDTDTFGVPYDEGAHWLHNDTLNPFIRYGKENGFSLYPAPDNELLYVQDQEASAADWAGFEEAMESTIDAIDAAGDAGLDVSAASVQPDLGPWGPTARFLVGPYEMGKDLEGFSCKDWYTGADGDDWYCREGFGTLWRHSAQGIAVQLNTVAQTIRWDGPDVTVVTNKGDLRAKACIVTASTGVMASGSLRFEPALPLATQEAFQGVSMGHYNHIALQFKDNVFGAEDDSYLAYQVAAEAPGAVGFLTNVSGTNLTYGDVGGRFAQELEAEGEDAAVDFTLGELRKIFGSDIDRSFIKAAVTSWGQNPYVQGAYASAEPGAASLRSQLRTPVGERIWFAGEACSRSLWATVAGAHKSGQEVARAVSRKLA
ncbi:flavin monoamine oxidase family protein [Rhodovibrionaceae bacterium A322]